jgi:hypothetical protein
MLIRKTQWAGQPVGWGNRVPQLPEFLNNGGSEIALGEHGCERGIDLCAVHVLSPLDWAVAARALTILASVSVAGQEWMKRSLDRFVHDFSFR